MDQHGESWLSIDSELVHLWDYLVDANAAITNTELLFTASSRPHFDFFLPRLTQIIPSPETAQDQDWQELLGGLQAKKRSVDELKTEISQFDPAQTILITDEGRTTSGIVKLDNIRVINLKPKTALLNIEPAWRELRLKLNKQTFNTVLVNMGPERAIIIPRLAQVYGAKALDITPFSVNLAVKKKNILRRVHGKIKRMLNRS